MTCTAGTVTAPAQDAGGGRLVATITDPDANDHHGRCSMPDVENGAARTDVPDKRAA
jgi:hypothetical protein